MFRTRDFVLLFTTIVFLVGAIGATLVDQWRDGRNLTPSAMQTAPIASSSDLVLTGSLPGNPEEERIQRLNRMRDKIAAATIEPEPESTTVTPEPEENAEATTTEQTATSSVLASASYCASYAPYAGFWDARGLTVEQREGARVVERLVGTTTEVVLQLPTRTQPAALPSCIGSDVIGIANDGSLIRNDEAEIYRIFSVDTVIGYALDGFPIYGGATEQTDQCGGSSVAGQYAYYLNPERAEIINCFASFPITLP